METLWLPSWKCRYLHAMRPGETPPQGITPARAECGVRVYALQTLCEAILGATDRINAGLPRCKRCEQALDPESHYP